MIGLAILLAMQGASDDVADWPCADALILKDWDSSVPIKTLASRIGFQCHHPFSSQANGDAAARDGARFRRQMENFIFDIEGKILNRRLNRQSTLGQIRANGS